MLLTFFLLFIIHIYTVNACNLIYLPQRLRDSLSDPPPLTRPGKCLIHLCNSGGPGQKSGSGNGPIGEPKSVKPLWFSCVCWTLACPKGYHSRGPLFDKLQFSWSGLPKRYIPSPAAGWPKESPVTGPASLLAAEENPVTARPSRPRKKKSCHGKACRWRGHWP